MRSRAQLPLGGEAILSSVAAAAVAALLLWLGPPGSDFAAHAYQRTLFLEHGFVLWNNFWYAGRYSFVTYSVLYYPLAAVLGIKVLAVASVATAALAFVLLAGREWGAAARLSTRTFAVIWAGIVLSAAFPFALGAAFALLAMLALQAGNRWRFAVLGLLTLAASPLAFVLLAVVLLGLGVSRRGHGHLLVPVGLMTAAAVVEVLLFRLFPATGHYPFQAISLAAIVLFCVYGAVLTWGVERARPLRGIFLVYLAVCVAAFVVPSDIGSNVERLRYAALPIGLLVISLRRWRPLWLVLPALALTFAWNMTPLADNFAQAESDPAAAAAYWRPVTAFLQQRLGTAFRVEAVDTVGHWPAVYLPDAGIPLVRGWYRQADFPENQLLYGRIGPRAYRAWLRTLGVRYVVLTDAPPDYSAAAEARLLRSGRSGLQVALRAPHATVYELSAPRPIVTGPAWSRVDWLGESAIWFTVGAAGRYRIALRYSPYWQSEQGCVQAGRDGMVLLTARASGFVQLSFDVGPATLLRTLVGGRQRRCS